MRQIKAFDKEDTNNVFYDIKAIDFDEQRICLKFGSVRVWRRINEVQLIEQLNEEKDLWEGDIVEYEAEGEPMQVVLTPEFYWVLRLDEQLWNSVKKLGSSLLQPELV